VANASHCGMPTMRSTARLAVSATLLRLFAASAALSALCGCCNVHDNVQLDCSCMAGQGPGALGRPHTIHTYASTQPKPRTCHCSQLVACVEVAAAFAA
jgi:hypothetical protein